MRSHLETLMRTCRVRRGLNRPGLESSLGQLEYELVLSRHQREEELFLFNKEQTSKIRIRSCESGAKRTVSFAI